MGTHLITRQKDDVSVIDVSGKLTLTEGYVLREKLRELAQAGSLRVILNMADVKDIDGSGIGELMIGYTTIIGAGGQMKLLNVGNRLRELLEITRLGKVFETHDNEASAVRSFAGCRAGARQMSASEMFIG